MTSRLLVSALLVLGCAAPKPQGVDKRPVVALASAAAPASVSVSSAPPSASAPAAKPSSTAAFGGERWGFIEASSFNGRLVVLRRFAGDQAPTFGQHGESSTETDLALFDTVQGSEREFQELIDIDPKRRWLLMLGAGLWIVDSNTGSLSQLEQADLDQDLNGCLPPRQATFAVDGSRVAWVRGAKELRVRELASGVEWSVPAKGRLWRGWSDAAGRGATLLEVPAVGQEWPSQNTSCACRWCTRFAASYGFYGWSGPAFTVTHVDDAGARRSVAEAPSSEAPAHGATDRKCTLEAAKRADPGLERGPWHWKCP